MTEINLLYSELSDAYDMFNARLFGDTLPDCMMTLTRQKRSYGFFSHKAYRSRGGDYAPEISLNPETFLNREAIETYSTLVHEMCHYYQQLFGTPSRSGYHNKEFASIMDSVGLTPSATGQPGGKRTGQSMSHYITPGGLFEQVYNEFAANRISQWGAISMPSEAAKRESKVKYECPECGQKAWAKPGSHLACGCLHSDESGWVEMVSAYLL